MALLVEINNVNCKISKFGDINPKAFSCSQEPLNFLKKVGPLILYNHKSVFKDEGVMLYNVVGKSGQHSFEEMKIGNTGKVRGTVCFL